MVQSGTPSWASCPEQECHCSVLSVGMMEPAGAVPADALLADPLLACVGPVPVWVVAAEPDVQAVTPVSAARLMVSAATPARRPRVRPPRRDIDMDPMIPHHA